MTSPNPYAPPESKVDDVHPIVESPPLWNPNAAASWSLLFSPLFGAFLQMKNWEAMGESANAQVSRRWVIASVVFLTIILLLAIFTPDSKGAEGGSNLVGLLFLLSWYFSHGKRQNVFVVSKYGKNYPRKGWLKPLSLAILAFAGFVLGAGLLSFVLYSLGILA